MQLFLDNDGQNLDHEKTFDIFNKIFDGIN
jgi:hypothetical protein